MIAVTKSHLSFGILAFPARPQVKRAKASAHGAADESKEAAKKVAAAEEELREVRAALCPMLCTLSRTALRCAVLCCAHLPTGPPIVSGAGTCTTTCSSKFTQTSPKLNQTTPILALSSLQARAKLASVQAEVVGAGTQAEALEARQRVLLAKQGGGKQYGSAKERDAVLQRQVGGMGGQEPSRAGGALSCLFMHIPT